MFSKTLLVALLSLSLTVSTIAAPAQDFGFHPPSNSNNNNKSNQNNAEQCSQAVKTVTVTASSAQATAKGGNNAAGNGAAGNNSVSSVLRTTSIKATATAAATLVKGTVAASSAAAAATSTAAAAAGGSGSCAGVDLQSCLTLDPSVIAKGFENDGQDVPEAGQVASLTSSNNFINFCATVSNLPITNGQQVKTGSCNPAPMGIIAATTNMPSSKFVFPNNFATIKANTEFTIQMAINNLETGNFVNANDNYFSAPQQVNSAGNIQGHSHVVVEAIPSLDSTAVTDPTRFAFFKGLNSAAANGVLTADVTSGLPAGTYRLASINTAANHQPALVAIAQHGSLDDMVYFTVTDDGQPAAGSNSTAAAAASASSAPAAAASAATASAAAGKGAAGQGAAGKGAAGQGAAGQGAANKGNGGKGFGRN